MRNAAKFGLAFLGLIGCQMTDAAPVAPSADACGAASLQQLVGQPKSVLQGMRLRQPVRVIGPNTRVTMDYSPSRLNIELDASGKIVRVSCG